MRVASQAIAISAAALVAAATVSPLMAQANEVAVVPLDIPADILATRDQPAFGATLVPMSPGQQPLTDALLSNYVKRQQDLRSVDVTLEGPQPHGADDVAMGYIARASFAGTNPALAAIDGLALPDAPAHLPSVTSDQLAAYIENGYQPLETRVALANKERDCLATAIYHEARGESAEGQLAVANVIVNRARSGAYPGSLCGVIYQNADKGLYRCQFTFACDGVDKFPSERTAWARSQDLAQRVYAEYATGEEIGALPDTALFYHTTAVSPSWSNTYTELAQVGAHIFYAKN